MNSTPNEKALDMLAELVAREKIHTQILMSLAYPSLTDQGFQDQMQMIEIKIAQLKEVVMLG